MQREIESPAKNSDQNMYRQFTVFAIRHRRRKWNSTRGS